MSRNGLSGINAGLTGPLESDPRQVEDPASVLLATLDEQLDDRPAAEVDDGHTSSELGVL